MNVKKLFFVTCHLFGVLSFAQVGITATTLEGILTVKGQGNVMMPGSKV